jgi:hypothetical protein
LNVVPSSKPPSNSRASKTQTTNQIPVGTASDGKTAAPPVRRKTAVIATVSHTLDLEIAERLRHFAFRERMSESAVIEFALRALFESGDEALLGDRLREAGAALRRRNRLPGSRSD